MNVLNNHLFLFSCGELVLCTALAIAFRGESRRLRTSLVFSALAALLSAGESVFAPWTQIMAAAALMLSSVHLVFGFGLRHATRDRLPKIMVEMAITAGYVAAVTFVLTRMGVNLTGLLATSAVATALVGLSLQDSLSNLVAGISLQAEQSVSTGDWIKTNGGTGQVKYIRLRHTLIETADSDHILVPNSMLTKTEVTILSVRRRRLVPFLVSYGLPPTRLISVVEEALRARKIPDIAVEPEPRCIVMEFAPQNIQMGVYLWLQRPGHEHAAISEAMVRIYFALSRIGVQVGLSPHVLEMRQTEVDKDAVLDQARAREGALGSMDLFRSLSGEELQALSRRIVKLSFAPDEPILRQGEPGDSLYFIAHGDVRVLIGEPGKPPVEVAQLHAGSFFGEMSLLTGQNRSATVVAIGQVDCWCLQKPDVQDILQQRPEILRDMAAVLDQRSEELSAARQRLHWETSLRDRVEAPSGLLEQIQRFFG